MAYKGLRRSWTRVASTSCGSPWSTRWECDSEEDGIEVSLARSNLATKQRQAGREQREGHVLWPWPAVSPPIHEKRTSRGRIPLGRPLLVVVERKLDSVRSEWAPERIAIRNPHQGRAGTCPSFLARFCVSRRPASVSATATSARETPIGARTPPASPAVRL